MCVRARFCELVHRCVSSVNAKSTYVEYENMPLIYKNTICTRRMNRTLCIRPLLFSNL